MMTKIEKLLQSSMRVFTVQDLASFWAISDKKRLWNNIRYYLRIGKLGHVHKGIYTIGKYSSLDLAQKLITPSYISFYTALAKYGIIFQQYETIHSMAEVSKTILIKNKKFTYHQLKKNVFFDSLGIVNKETYQIAGPERAVCDSLYLVPSLGFDNMDAVNPEKLLNMAIIYNNKQLVKRVNKLLL